MTCEVQFRTKVGWYLLWDNGWTSSMPDEATARLMAETPALLALLHEARNVVKALLGAIEDGSIEALEQLDDSLWLDFQRKAADTLFKIKGETP